MEVGNRFKRPIGRFFCGCADGGYERFNTDMNVHDGQMKNHPEARNAELSVVIS